MSLEHPDWHCAPVASQGPAGAPLLIVGLAPGAAGANRTGVPFFGDDSGAFLHPALIDAGLAAAAVGGGILARRIRITNAVRCLPPANRPSSAERTRCRPFLLRELGELLEGGRSRRPAAVLALGRVAHEAVLDALGRARARAPFTHGGRHALDDDGVALLFDTYHPSRYNVHTGRLTRRMLDAVLGAVVDHLAARGRP